MEKDYTILLGKDSFDDQNFQEDYQTIYENFCLISYIQDKILIDIEERYKSVNYKNVYIDRLQLKKGNGQKHEILYLVRSQKQQFQFSKDKTLKIVYYILKPEIIEKVNKIAQKYDQEIVQDNSEILKGLQEKQINKQFIKALMNRFSPSQKKLFKEKIKASYKQKLKENQIKQYECLFISMRSSGLIEASSQKPVNPDRQIQKFTGQFEKIEVKFNISQKSEIKIQITTKSDLEKIFPKPLFLMPFNDLKNQTVKFPKKKGEIQYFYQEPKNIKVSKSPQFHNQHFSIALQGGGVKGISYIGAYKSFMEHFRRQAQEVKDSKELYKQVKIKSVIGSSAGGILGLAICTGVDAEEIENVCIQYLQNVPKEDKKYPQLTEREKKLKNEQLKDLRNFIVDSRILSEDLVELITSILAQQKVQQSLLELMTPSIKELFTIDDNDTKKMCILGLLMGALMKGDKIGEIAVEIIAVFLKKEYQKKKVHLDQMEHIRQYARKVTLSQFYEETHIQFTCTSVDLDDQILRFFNHKTTPLLPVYKAVQMTGSFPVGFEAQKWKKQWGKYHVHYRHSRRQKSLMIEEQKGHQFTDGGVLANFPVKYLDNTLMREKYFFHPNNEKTIIFGLGFNYFNEFTENKDDQGSENSEKQNPFTNLRNNIFEEGILKGSSKNPINYMSLFGKVVKEGAKMITDAAKNKFWHANEAEINLWEKQPFENLRKVKLFNFVFSLLLTYMKSKDNLTKQCFSYLGMELQNQYIEKKTVHKSSQHDQHNKRMASFFTKYLEQIKGQQKQIQKQIQQRQSSCYNQICHILNQTKGLKKEDRQEILKRIEPFKNKQDQQNGQQKTEQKEKQKDISISIKEYVSSEIYHYVPEIRVPDDIIKQKYFKLIQKYMEFDKLFKNLVIRTYKHFPGDQSTILQRWRNRTKDQIQEIKTIIQQDIGSNSNQLKDPKEIVIYNLKKVLEKLESSLQKKEIDERLITKNNQQISYILNQLIVALMDSLKQLDVKTRSQLLRIKQKIFNKEKNNIFVYGNLQDRVNCLYENGKSLKEILNSEAKVQQDIFDKIYYEQLQFLEEQISLCIQEKKKIMNKLSHNSSASQNFDLDQYELAYETAQNFYTTAQQLFTAAKQTSTAFINIIKNCKIREIRTSSETFKQKGNIAIRFKSVLLKNINFVKEDKIQTKKQQQQVSIHLVFESSPSSQLYLQQICEEIQYEVETMSRIQQNQESHKKIKIRIGTITASSYNAIAMFLFASNLKPDKLTEKVKKIKNLVQLDQRVFKSRQENSQWNEQWSKSCSGRVFDTLKYFYCLERICEFKDASNKEKELDDRKKDFQNKINNFMDDVCEMIAATDIQCNSNSKKFHEEIQKILQISKSNILKGDKENQATSLFFTWLIGKYKDIILYTAMSTPFFLDQIQYPIFHTRKKDLWRAILICQVLRIDKIKSFVETVLEQQLHLDKNITLLSFYKASSKKIKLNFTICNFSKQCIEFFNHKSTPQMPLTAAIMASMSIPLFMSPFKGQSEWKYVPVNEKSDFKSREVYRFFETRDHSTSEYYTGDILNKIPLQLVSNKKIKTLINGDKFYQKIEEPKQQERQVSQEDLRKFFDKSKSKQQKIKDFEKLLNNKKASKKEKQEIFFLVYFKNNQNSIKDPVKESYYFLNYSKSVKNKSISNTDLLTIVWNLLGTSIKYGFGFQHILPSQNIKSVQGISQRKGILDMYINSHDKLIFSTYNKELVNLPIRLDTLQFEKIGDPFHNSQLSNQAVDVIKQSQYVMQEKLLNTYPSYLLFTKEDDEMMEPLKKYCSQKQEDKQILKILKEYRVKRSLQNIKGKSYHLNLRDLSFENGSVKGLKTVSHLNYIYLKDRYELLAIKYMFIKIENYEPVYKPQHKHPYFKQNQFYIRFLSYMNNSKDLHQKRRVRLSTDPELSQESFKEVQQQYIKLNYQKGKNVMSIFIQVDFPHILNTSPEEAQKRPKFEVMSLKTNYFEWKLPEKLGEDIDKIKRNKFEEYYQIPYSTYIKQHCDGSGFINPYRTIENRQDKRLIIKSVQSKNKKNNLDQASIYCLDCYSSILYPIKAKDRKDGQCASFSCRNKNAVLFYGCKQSSENPENKDDNNDENNDIDDKKNKQCKEGSKFCLQCAYKLRTDSDLSHNSEIGHLKCNTILQEPHDIKKLLKLENNPEFARQCDFCGLVPSRFFYDKECNVVFCEQCKKNLLNRGLN